MIYEYTIQPLLDKYRELDLSPQQIANLAGVSGNGVHKIFSGVIANPRMDTLVKLCNALEVDPRNLIITKQ